MQFVFLSEASERAFGLTEARCARAEQVRNIFFEKKFAVNFATEEEYLLLRSFHWASISLQL